MGDRFAAHPQGAPWGWATQSTGEFSNGTSGENYSGSNNLEGLRARWHSVCRRRAAAHLPRHLLFRILAYWLQADRLGDLDADSRRLLDRIGSEPEPVNGIERLVGEFKRSRTTLRPGTLLTREWDGQLQRVMVLDHGFSWNGNTYGSLSKVAFAITGARWNGPRFFGLRDRSEVQS